jgi:hypothetical protein
MLNECWIATLSWSKIALCAHFECNIALHVDTTTSVDGTYKISQESAEDASEDQGNVTKGLSEAPNQSLEDNNTNIPDFSPTSKGKPWCITQYFRLLHYAILYLYIIPCIKSKSWDGTLDAWILGTNVLYLSPHCLDALLIGPVEVGWFPVTRAI